MELSDRLKNIPFWKHIGIEKMEVLSPGNVKLTMKVKDELLNLFGVLHGGVTSSLIDSALGAAVWSLQLPNTRLATVEMKVNYFSAVPPGYQIEANAKVINHGKTLVIGTVEVKNQEDNLVAFGTGTYILIKSDKEKESSSFSK